MLLDTYGNKRKGKFLLQSVALVIKELDDILALNGFNLYACGICNVNTFLDYVLTANS